MHRRSPLPLALLAACGPAVAPEAPSTDTRFEVAPESRGTLAPDIIQTAVRQNFQFFRRCYEAGLARNPQLKGRVVTRFMIGVSGQVTRVTDDGSDLPDPEVIQCVVRRFLPIAFPPPDGGVVVVIYPIGFAPHDPAATSSSAPTPAATSSSDPAPTAASSSAPTPAAPAPIRPALTPTKPTPWPALSSAKTSTDSQDHSPARLPPSTIQSVVRQSFGAFRVCYEQGLKRDKNLQGNVNVRFVIGLDGRVTWVGDGGSTLPDPETARCVIESFRPLVFPAPDGGVLKIVYPISFAPGG